MRTPRAQSVSAPSEFMIRQVKQPDLDWYRRLFREIGEPWLWFSRLRMTDGELRSIIDDQAMDVFALSYKDRDQGLLEFDRRSFSGHRSSVLRVAPALIGKGAGRALFAHGLASEWQRHPQRIWLHT
jgi:hypothetical protein